VEERIEELMSRLGAAIVRPAGLFDLLLIDPQDADRVIEVIRDCPALAARVLAVVNSAAFGLSRRIHSVPRAVNLLGAGRARMLALAHGLCLLNEASGLPDTLVNLLWTNCINKAVAARLFCQVIDDRRAEEAYALALIQDIALPMFMAADPGFYREQMTGPHAHECWCDREQAYFGVDHTQLGARMLQEWGANTELQNAVASHHQPPAAEQPDESRVTVELATFYASLLPHAFEQPGPNQLEWFEAMHARCLYPESPSPDHFMGQVQAKSRKICGRQNDLNPGEREEMRYRLIGEVSADAAAMVERIYHLEHRLLRERDGLLEMRAHAMTDPLTQLLNRRGLMALGDRGLQYAHESATGICCILIDLDDFKFVNDTHGHEIGDQLLVATAMLLRSSVRASDLIARIGGDEFAVLLNNVDQKRAQELAQRMVDNLESRMLRLGHDLDVTLHVSMGAAYYGEMSDDLRVDDLLSAADKAMYHRKIHGKRGLRFNIIVPEHPEQD
jgi:diguanylate cyclase (GGDEF)-like protein